MSIESIVYYEDDPRDEQAPHLRLVVDNTLAPPDIDISQGVISYREADGARNGVPVRLFGAAALRVLGYKA